MRVRYYMELYIYSSRTVILKRTYIYPPSGSHEQSNHRRSCTMARNPGTLSMSSTFTPLSLDSVANRGDTFGNFSQSLSTALRGSKVPSFGSNTRSQIASYPPAVCCEEHALMEERITHHRALHHK